jgi:ABC-type branched-subunit amino acid transport system substrate-binding protein
MHPQTYRANVGRGNYYVKKYGKGTLHGAYLFVADTKATRNTGFASTGALRETGIESDLDFDISAFSQQSAMTPAIQEMKAKGSTFGQTPTSSAMLSLRKEATLQGLTGVKVWDCPGSCYDLNFLSQGGADVEDNYVNLPFQPFFDKKEQKANPMTAAFVKYTGADNVGGFGAYAWAAGIAFRDEVNAAVEKHGINGVNRKTIFEALNQIHEFDADGFFGEIDLAGRELSKCAVLMRVKDGKFVRVRPTKVGTILCEPDAVIERKLDLLGT